jgi:hypothetical protein
MQEYLETTTLGDLIRKSRGEAKIATGAAAGDSQNTELNNNKRIETDLS